MHAWRAVFNCKQKTATAAAREYSLSASHFCMKPSRSSEYIVQPHLLLLKNKRWAEMNVFLINSQFLGHCTETTAVSLKIAEEATTAMNRIPRLCIVDLPSFS